MKNFIISLLCILVTIPTIGFSQETEIQGIIVDAQTNESLPFVSILIDNTTIGTASNLKGEFSLKIPARYSKNEIIFNLLGYETKKLAKSQISQEGKITLLAFALELATVEVRPISAEDYLKRCISKIPENYPDFFRGNVYFRQNMVDNNTTLQTSEGFAQAYFPNYLDTTGIQLRMLLFDNQENIDQLTFNKRKREKKLEKAQKKSIRKGEEFDEEAASKKASVFTSDIMTPDMLIDEDPIRKLEYFMDSTYFNDFNYQFEEDSRYLGRRVNVISFSTKKKAKTHSSSLKAKQEGYIYLDPTSDAIVGIDYKGKYIIPAAIKPILFLAGIGINNPTMKKKVRYIEYNGKWYPQSIQFNLNIKMERKHLFSKNEKSDVDSEILMTLNDLNFQNKTEIEESFRFVSNKPIEEQIYPTETTTWAQVNRISSEKQ